MKTQNTTTENIMTAVKLTFVPLIVAGVLSLIYGLITGGADTYFLATAVLPVDRIKEILKSYKEPKNLLGDGDGNTKISKNPGRSFGLSLAPYIMNSKGINICPKASKGCALACLFDTGLATVYKSVKKSRLFKTEFYIQNKTKFVNRLAREIQNKIKNNKGGSDLFFRLNTFSDLDFVGMLKVRTELNYAETPENVYFYDYTAILGKAIKYLNDSKYHLAFSRKEDNEREVEIALQLGINVAIVFYGELPKYYKGVRVINGDENDITMITNKGVIIGLKAKGKEAKQDKTGFVIQPETARKYDVKKYTFINDDYQSLKIGSARAFHNIG